MYARSRPNASNRSGALGAGLAVQDACARPSALTASALVLARVGIPARGPPCRPMRSRDTE